MSLRRGVIALAIGTLLAGCAAGTTNRVCPVRTVDVPQRGQTTIDPEWLIGEWQGQWTAVQASGPKYPGPYMLTIKVVSGGRLVYGEGTIRSVFGGIRPFSFVGVLEENRLTYPGAWGKTTLLIGGSEMRGTILSGDGSIKTVEVTKVSSCW